MTFNLLVRTLFIFLLMLSGCQEVINVSLPKGYKRLVIEGMITNEPGPYIVKLTKTRDYSYSYNDTALYETNARVFIHDDAGDSELLEEISPGYYVTDSSGIRGQSGRTYTLQIITREGTRYESTPELLKPVAKIDTIYYSLFLDERDKSGNPGVEGYIEFQDPPEENNYYLKKQLIYGMNGRLYESYFNVISDKYFNGNYLRWVILDQFNPEVRVGKTIQKIEIYSLSKPAYDFWDIMFNQTQEVGGPYDPPQAPIIGNIYNPEDKHGYALGFFSASAISHAQIIVDGSK